MNSKLRTIRGRLPLYNYSRKNNLFSGGGTVGALDFKNAFGKQGFKVAGEGLIGGLSGTLGTTIGGFASNAIAGGLNSDAGNAISKIGGLTGSAVGTVNPLLGGAISVGSLLVGGLTNRAFGTKVNQAKLNTVNQGIANLSNFNSSANSFDSILNPEAVSTDTNVYSGGWFSSGKARRKNVELLNKLITARDLASRSIDNNIFNLSNDLINNALSNYSAYGGYLDGINPSTPIGYSLYTDKYVKDRSKNNNQGMTNMFAGTTNTMFAFGGDILTNSADWSTGLTHINTGGSHESNPKDGVLIGVDNQGIPNLVEEGEVIYNDEDYVFSNRLIVPRGMRGNYGKRNKYAEGGKLNRQKSNEELISYEKQVLKPFEGMTFADAAKKAEKLSGANERPTDPIALRGLQSMLQVLAGTQEKEREKEKLAEMQEAIDNMTPEEFAMLQQQMKAQLVAQLQQEMAMQQLLMIPEGMELMQPVEQQQPISALGGILNTPDNMHPYGGSLDEFQRELSNYGLTLNDYLQYWESQTGNTIDGNTKLTTDNLNRDIAERYLDRIETITKQYNRRAKKQGIKVDDLQGATKAQYDRELNQAIQRGLTNTDYDVSKDIELTFNNRNISKARNKQQAYINIATYNDLLARGGRAVELDNLGRPTWESITGLNKIDNSNEEFYNNLGVLNEDELNNRGIYNYNAALKSSIDVDNYNNVKLRGWNKNEDGAYVVSNEYNNPNQTSLLQGNSDTTYPIADIENLKPDSDEYKAALKAIQDNADYRKQTDYVKNALEAANGEVEKLKENNPDVYNYIRYLDANSGNKKGKLLNEDGSLSKTAAEDYNRRRNDSLYGIYHYLFDDAKKAAANRYYYKDKDTGLNVYISRPEGTDFNISENPIAVTGADGTQFNDYEVTSLNKNRILTLLPTGEVVDVTNINDINNWTKLDKPVLVDNTDNLGYGINGTTDWVAYNNSKKLNNDPFPKPSSWPFGLAAALQLGLLGYNILSPKDYSDADAMISAALNAGTYNPIEFRPIGNYLTYRPMDIWFEQNRMNANARATDRAIMNNAAPIGTKMAGLLASNYNDLIANGNLYRLALEYNDALRKQVGEFNRGTDLFNSEGFLKADMANQDAEARARGYKLEGLKSGYAMRQAIDDAKANAINAGLSGLINLAYNYGTNRDKTKLLGWLGKSGANGPMDMSEYGRESLAHGGRIRRKKGLSF